MGVFDDINENPKTYTNEEKGKVLYSIIHKYAYELYMDDTIFSEEKQLSTYFVAYAIFNYFSLNYYVKKLHIDVFKYANHYFAEAQEKRGDSSETIKSIFDFMELVTEKFNNSQLKYQEDENDDTFCTMVYDCAELFGFERYEHNLDVPLNIYAHILKFLAILPSYDAYFLTNPPNTQKHQKPWLIPFLLIVSLCVNGYLFYKYNEIKSLNVSYSDKFKKMNKEISDNYFQKTEMKSKLSEAEDKLDFFEKNACIVSETGNKYHKYDCPHATEFMANGFYIFNVEYAEYYGYEPCKDCYKD